MNPACQFVFHVFFNFLSFFSNNLYFIHVFVAKTFLQILCPIHRCFFWFSTFLTVYLLFILRILAMF